MTDRSPVRFVVPALLALGCTEFASSEAAPSAIGSDAGLAMVEGQARAELADTAPPRRVLLVIADDLSASSTAMYAADFPDVDFEPASLPTVESLCSDGVRFRRAWSAPTCAPTRATMLTGRYNFRNDTINLMGKTEDELPVDEPTLPRLMSTWSPDTAMAQFGKWNLGHTDRNGGDLAPNVMGWPHFAGFLEPVMDNYFQWQRTVNGVTAPTTEYATTQTVDDTIAWLETVPEDQSWVAWVAFTAPHAPFHAPPEALHDYELVGEPPTAESPLPPDEVRPFYYAAAQSMDTELGRLLDWLEAHGQGDTDIIFIGDNGSPIEVLEAPFSVERGKGSVYEGGVHVPLCMSGPSVAAPGRVVESPVGAVDILATVLDLGGAPVDEVLATGTFDSQSLAPVLRDPEATLARDWAYTEGRSMSDATASSRALIQGGQKLVQHIGSTGTRELYDVEADPYEADDRLLPGGSESARSGADTYDSEGRHDGEEDHDEAELEDAVAEADALQAVLRSLVGN